MRFCRLTLWWVLLYRFKILGTKETTQEKKFKRPLEEALDRTVCTELGTAFAGWTRTLQNSDLDVSQEACLSEFCKSISGEEAGHGKSIRSSKSTVITWTKSPALITAARKWRILSDSYAVLLVVTGFFPLSPTSSLNSSFTKPQASKGHNGAS